MLIEKRSGEAQQFSRSKLAQSIQKAAITGLPVGQANEIADRVVQSVTIDRDGDMDDNPTSLSSESLGEAVLRVTRADPRLEAVHVRYALLFEPARGGFDDARSFLKWLGQQQLVTRRPRTSEAPEWVIKRSGSPARFELDKLEASIRFAAKKRPDEAAAADDRRLGEVVARHVMEQVRHQRVVTSGQLATEVMRALRTATADEGLLQEGERQLAYLRVASTAKGFTRAEDFAAEASGMLALNE